MIPKSLFHKLRLLLLLLSRSYLPWLSPSQLPAEVVICHREAQPTQVLLRAVWKALELVCYFNTLGPGDEFSPSGTCWSVRVVSL